MIIANNSSSKPIKNERKKKKKKVGHIGIYINPLTYNIESYSWYKLRSRFERKSKLQTYEISNQILNLISLNWTLIDKSYMQCFDTLNTLN